MIDANPIGDSSRLFFPPSSCFLMMSFTKAHSQDGGLLIFSSIFCVFFFLWEEELCSFWAGTLFVSLHRLNNWKIFERKKKDPLLAPLSNCCVIGAVALLLLLLRLSLYISFYYFSVCEITKKRRCFSPPTQPFYRWASGSIGEFVCVSSADRATDANP